MILKSIKWRLQAWHSFLLLVLVVGLMTGFYTYERRVRLQTMDTDLREAMTPLLPRYAPPRNRGPEERGPRERGRRPPPPEDGGMAGPDDGSPDGEPPRDLRNRGGRISLPEKVYFVVWSENGERVSASTNAPANLERPQLRRPGNFTLMTRAGNREYAHVVPEGTMVLVGTPLGPVQHALEKLALGLGLIGAGIVILGLAVGWWLATRALRPIAEISHAAQEIAGGELSRRINPSETESELGELAAVLNSTFARLEAAFAQQKQFTSDAAHELRTPVAVILTQTQSTLNRERTPEEYRETLEACQRAALRMKKLVEALLQLARLEGGKDSLQWAPMNLATLAAEGVELVRPLAAERGITLKTDFAATPCSGDADRLALVLTNLLTNAIHHHHEAGEVQVRTHTENGQAILTVTDNGPGIAAEHLPHIFDRFYRAEAARTAAQGRSGLGLAISKAIVTAHGGRIEVTSKVGEGATFTVRLPTV